MKFLKHIRSKSKLKNGAEAQSYDSYAPTQAASYSGNHSSPISRLPAKILGEIFASVCPHTRDESYSTSEDSMIDDGCMLCDMRDLAQCALVCRQWTGITQDLLYHSIRVDAVHYCEREVKLAEKRKRRSFFDRNADPKDAPQQRLQLLSRTVRETAALAVQVHYLKMPYMTRETCKADLARTVSVLPNLRFVDLPEGFYSDDNSANTLKNELQSRCPDIRKMKYFAGAEGSFTALAQHRPWQNMEDLELSGISVEPSTLLYVLGSFPVLHRLKLVDLPWLDDQIFTTNPSIPPFPAVNKLTLESIPNISSHGFALYLSRPETREALASLSLAKTGILSTTLHEVLARAPRLDTLSISENVERSFPLSPTPPLSSRSLQILNFEILSSNTNPHTLHPPSESYYNYLSTSLMSGTLPSLSALYAFSPSLPLLLLAPPTAPFAPKNGNSPYTGLRHPLNLYTKSTPELEWDLTVISPPTPTNRRGSATATRPVSTYSNFGLGPAWGGQERDSVIVGNGFGGFLAVPTESGAGRSGIPGGGKKGGTRTAEWMG
ncbi:f-box domain protein [Lasallia pustulata]|uniref:F-box domain protein n=1 Tax=Lasallia pustulata TaxID=136370 RepID=A0A1W5CW04_9LECA|nr:f-box domain protein [Lasallia pustulata]